MQKSPKCKLKKIKFQLASGGDVSCTDYTQRISIFISIYIYIIAKAKRKWVPAIKEVVTRLS